MYCLHVVIRASRGEERVHVMDHPDLLHHLVSFVAYKGADALSPPYKGADASRRTVPSKHVMCS